MSHIGRARRVGLGLLFAVGITAGAGPLVGSWGPPAPLATPSPFPTDLCDDDPPALAVVCYSPSRSSLQHTTTVLAVRDRPSPAADVPLASTDQVGAVWGLADRVAEPALYAAAFHKRAYPFGPGGPGQIYRVDLRSGAVSPFIAVPDAGPDTHSPLLPRDYDEAGRNGAGKTSLGGMVLSDDGAELFVVNLFDRRIDRFELPSGRLLGRFDHGAAGTPWAADARPFGLAFHDGWLFHGVVNSAESTQRAADLAAYVYASRSDGTDMHEVVRLPLDYPRGEARIPALIGGPLIVDVSLAWNPWQDGYNAVVAAQLALFPQPVVSDLAFTTAGDMLIGLRDRQGDVSIGDQVMNFPIEKPGLGVGDLVLARRQGDRWEPVLPDGGGLEPYRDTTSLADSSVTGGLAELAGLDAVAAGNVLPDALQGDKVIQSVTWFRHLDGNRVRRHDLACGVYSGVPTPIPFARLPGLRPLIAHADDEWAPIADVGDVAELRCRAVPTPSATPVPTGTPTPTATATDTTTPTRVPSATATRPAYLPVVVDERCLPGQQHSDVVLVVDASRSMLDQTAAGRPKIDAAKDAVRAFVQLLDPQNDQAALVWFNATAATAQDLTGDPAALVAALDRIPVQQYTRIHLGLAEARRALSGPARRTGNTPVVVLLSDGRSDPDPPELAVAAAAALKADGVRVFTIGLGPDLDVGALQGMATAPDHFRRAADGEDLGAVYRRIALELPCPPERYFPHPQAGPGAGQGTQP
jgi:Mg-chelatase subunit ChlD